MIKFFEDSHHFNPLPYQLEKVGRCLVGSDVKKIN